jgi:phage terminase large subunit-like protein
MSCNVAEHESAQAPLAHLRTGGLWRGRGDEWVSYEEVVASRGKVQRAEPVAALYEPEKQMVSHVPKDDEDLTQLEDQMCPLIRLYPLERGWG